MELPESIIEVLDEVVFSTNRLLAARGLGSRKEEKERRFKENPSQFLVSLLLALRKRLKEDRVSAMLDSSVEMALYDNYLEEARKLLGKEEVPLPEKAPKKKAS